MIRRSISLALLLAVTPATLLSNAAIAASDSAQKIIKNAEAAKGFINLFYDAKSAQLYLQADKLNQPFLLLTSLPHGVGSNDIGFDRGLLGQTRMVHFEQHGPYVVLKQLNTYFRASSANVAEQSSGNASFC